MPIFLTVSAGPRCGEILGLRAPDLNFDPVILKI